MIDFTKCEINRFKGYGGANGGKINIIYNSESYMLKFPVSSRKNPRMSYNNSCISEYLGCHIFSYLDLPAQETILGTYKNNGGKTKIVVACKDFTDISYDGERFDLMEFAQLKNTCIESNLEGFGTDINSVLQAIEEQTLIEVSKLKGFFWDMFIADALIGNFDRHNGNWGILVNQENKTARIAPIYDCGSCLYPQIDSEMIKKVLNDEDEINQRIYLFPTSALMSDNKKLSYFDTITSQEYPGCNAALKRIAPRIDLKKINSIIDSVPYIDDLQKTFYKTMLRERKTKIIDFAFQKLTNLL